MISTVTIERQVTAQVAVEHPDEWDDEQIAAAVRNRAIDVGSAAALWSGDQRTTIAGIAIASDYRDEMDEDTDYRPDPVELTEDDLDAPADPVVEDTAEAGDEAAAE